MKILSVQFQNINSLAGENRINFNDGPFADAGVFAITGNNGSGKSSILDAITLALYGETCRFDQPAAHVITQNTDEAFAEVLFQSGEEQYRTRWQAGRNRLMDGAATATEMRLTRLSDQQELAATPARVRQQIAELTGLDFRAFTRCVLLPQGDSAAFLTAPDNDRIGILETLSGRDIYQEYRSQILAKAAQARQGIEAIQQELAQLNILSPAQQEATEHDLADSQAQLAELKNTQKQWEQQQILLKHFGNLNLQITAQNRRINNLSTQLASTEQSLAQIGNAGQAQPLQDLQATLNQAQQTLQALNTERQALLNEQQFLREQLANQPELPNEAKNLRFAEQHEAIDQIKFDINQARLDKQTELRALQILDERLAEKSQSLVETETWLANHQPDAGLLAQFPETAKLKKLRAELVQREVNHKQAAINSKKSQAALKSAELALSNAQDSITRNKQQQVETATSRNALLQGYPVEDLDLLLSTHQERAQQFQELYQLAAAYQQLGASRRRNWPGFNSSPWANDNSEHLAAELAELQALIKREENIKLALEESVYREALLKKMVAERSHLVDGKPCPLCGSKQHPYLRQPPVISNSVKALADQQIRVLELTKQAELLQNRQKRLTRNHELSRAAKEKRQKIQAAWTSLSNRLNKATENADIQDLATLKNWQNQADSELRHVQGLVADYQKKTVQLAKLGNETDKLEATLGLLQDRVTEAAHEHQARSQALAQLTETLAQCRQEEHTLATKVLAQLTELGESLPGKGKEDAFFDRLNARRQDYQTYLFRKQNLQEEQNELQTRYAQHQAAIARLDQTLANRLQQLPGEELIATHLALVEKQQRLAAKELEIAAQETEVTRIQHQLNAALANSPFTSITEAQQVLALASKASEFTERQTNLALQLASSQEHLAELARQAEAMQDSVAALPTADDIYRELTLIAERSDLLQMESQHHQKRLTQQSQALQRQEELTRELAQREQAAAPALAEAAQLDHENGMVFRRRAQQQWAAQLLDKTNRILEKINGRYYLRQQMDADGLALMVEDTLQNNLQRLPKTLSGGESFVVSLALALGMSELANNNRAVDSLFIDEGFGNLDSEALPLALATLENLRNIGKTVGVISHVEAVKKRIKTQLQVVKKADGIGTLKMAS